MGHRAAAAIIAVCLAFRAVSAPCAETGEAHAARLAQLQPDSVTISRDSNMVFISGGDLGRFDVRASAEENLRTLIEHLGLLSNVAKHAEFTVTRQEPTFVDFSQVIGGVPVWARNQIDLGPDGRVLAARLSIADPALAPKAQPIARARAMQIASHAYAAQYGVVLRAVDLHDDPGLQYRPAALGEPLKVQYRFVARAVGTEGAFVTVDAITGAVKMVSVMVP
jgi:hypothetical protein